MNLAAEISSHKGSLAAAEALLLGSANAAKHRSVYDPKQHVSKSMTQFREDQSLNQIRQQLFDCELPNNPNVLISSSGGGPNQHQQKKVCEYGNAFLTLHHELIEREHRSDQIHG